MRAPLPTTRRLTLLVGVVTASLIMISTSLAIGHERRTAGQTAAGLAALLARQPHSLWQGEGDPILPLPGILQAELLHGEDSALSRAAVWAAGSAAGATPPPDRVRSQLRSGADRGYVTGAGQGGSILAWARVEAGEHPARLVLLSYAPPSPGLSRGAATGLMILLSAGLMLLTLAAAGRLERASLTDGLMEIYNHRYLKSRLAQEIRRADRRSRPLSVLLIDIDFFKQVNDTYGHVAGDRVLTAIGRRVLQSVRESDVVARYGGEEIACILPNTGLAGAQVVAERLCRKIRAQAVPWSEAGPPLQVTVSIGVAGWEPDLTTADFLARADAALYQAKAGGRNQVALYPARITPEADLCHPAHLTPDHEPYRRPHPHTASGRKRRRHR